MTDPTTVPNRVEPGTEMASRRGLRASVREFFFALEVPYGLALCRMVLPVILLYVVLRRWSHAREFFSSDGASAPLADNYGYFNMLPVPSGTMAVILMTLLVMFLVTMSVGWRTRVSVIGCLVIYTYLNMLDCLSTFTKYSVIASHVLLLLSFSRCGAVWSVDAWLDRRKRIDWTGPPRFPAWPRRLMQLLIGLIYLGAAITKIHTPTFFSGDQLRFWLMTDVNHSNPMGEQLTLYPVMVVTMAYISVVWEILFIFTCWRGHGRWIMLLLGAGFHLGTRQTLGLFVFPWVSMTTYLAFINASDVVRWQGWWARFWPEKKDLSAVPRRTDWHGKLALAFPATLLVTAVLGVELEHWIDPYGIRRQEGPHQLVELDRATVEAMLESNPVMRPEDLVHSLEMGEMLVGGYVVGHKSTFRQGERLFAQCTLNPPHPDLMIECNLHDKENRLLDRVQQVVPRETFRANFLYVLHDALVPGEYSLVVRCGGQEVARRRIVLESSKNVAGRAPVAN
ncbi:HTTM domain-containing protein [Planctomycetaceae bacterium]|nr:HTTM domain-containing protein [Planctomycetaceae bacterium]